MLRRWRDCPRLVIGSGGAHGSLLLGGVAAVLGGWSDGHAKRWLARRTRSLAGVSAGCIGAVGLALGLGPLRMAVMNQRFPYADIFARDVAAPPVRGMLRGFSLRTVALSVLAEGGVPPSLTFAELRERTGVDVRILATSLTELRLVVFSADTSPEVAVVDAMVASMSIPAVFAPHTIPGWGDFVDGGLLDPLGIDAFEGSTAKSFAVQAFLGSTPCSPLGLPPSPPPPFHTVWVGKAASLGPSRRADSLFSVLLSCMAASCQHSQRQSQLHGTGRACGPAMVSLSLGVRLGCDERDVAVGSIDLMRRPDVGAMLGDGLESADGCVLGAFLLLLLGAAAAQGSARPVSSPSPSQQEDRCSGEGCASVDSTLAAAPPRQSQRAR
jgi:predicted acylesterase/phospholipase RssA